jgi:HEAT repeat protein
VDLRTWAVEHGLHSSYLILAGLIGVALAVVALYLTGLLGWLIRRFGEMVHWSIRAGFGVWRRLFAWAPWPVFLAVTVGLIGLGNALDAAQPGAAVVCGLVVTFVGVVAVLAYMFIDLERYEVGRGFLATHNPLKGQRLAVHLTRYGHRLNVMLLVSAAVAAIGGFALLNLGLYETIGGNWYALQDEDRSADYADFLAYAVIHIYSIVDVLNLARARHLIDISYVRPAQWPASTLLVTYKTFFTLVLLQQVFASLRRGRLLAETIADFWSPHPPIHERARYALPQHGTEAVVPLLVSLRQVGALTHEQLDQIPLAIAALGPGSVPALVRHLADRQEHVRAVAAATLGHLHARDALGRLVPLAHDPSAEVREAVAEALGNLGVTTATAPPRKRRIHMVPAGWRAWLVDWRRPAPETVVINPVAVIVATLRGALGDPSAAVRVRAASALGQLGAAAADATPALVGALRDADETVRCQSATALGEIRAANGEVVTALAALLTEPSSPLKVAAAGALKELNAAAAPAVPALVDLLQDRDEGVRKAAAAAIGQIGTLDGQAGQELVEGLSSPDNVVRAQTAEALGVIGEVAAEDAAPALVEALADHNDQVRGKAAEALGRLGEAAADVAVPGLVRALRDGDNWVSALAADALGEMGDAADGAVPSLVHALSHMNPQVRASAAAALGKLGDAAGSARPALVTAIQDDDGYVRAQAVRALAQMGRPDADVRRVVRSALTDADPQVRAAAAEAIGEWADADADDLAGLIAALDDQTDQVKVAAIQALPKLGTVTPEVCAALGRRLLEDDSVWVAEQAAAALGRLGSEAAAAGPALLRAAQTGEVNVREQAVRTLAVIQPPEAAAAFIAGIRDADAEVRKVAAAGWMLATTVPPDAAPGLVEALTDPEVQVRANAAHALARLKDLPHEAVPLLLECLADASDGLRLNAALALERAPAEEVGPALTQLLDDPNLRVRLIAAGRVLAADVTDARAIAAVTEALAAPAPRLRSAAAALIETLDNPETTFGSVLRERVSVEPDRTLREQLQRLLGARAAPVETA